MERIDSSSFDSHASASLLRAYRRLLSGRAAAANDLLSPSGLPVGFTALGALLWLAVDYWLAMPHPTFFVEALLAWAWYAVVLLATVLWASRLSRPRVPFEILFRWLLMLLPVLVTLLIAMLLWVPEDWQFIAALAIAAYVSVYLAAVLRSLTLRAQPRAAAAILATLLSGVYLAELTYANAHFWSAAATEAEAASATDWPPPPEAEALLFAQSALIDAAIEKLHRPTELPIAAFFIGFAGFGDERVFAREIALAEHVIGQRFGSSQRSLRLVNDRRDLQSQPLATVSALRYALQQVAKRMQLDHDVLFLSLSSHGSEGEGLNVSNGTLPMQDLTATDLAAALHEAGIRWKVVIVSACFAGQFIEPLRDPDTIVIAAAAPDRTSFGCADDRDLTYFGEAFYRDALPIAADLRAAFDRAIVTIAERERAEDKQSSKPQAHFGSALEALLQTVFPPSG